MLKKIYDQGALAAFTRFGLEKVAVGMMPSALAGGRSFLRGQAGALGDVGQGLKGMLAPTAPARAAGGTQALAGAKGLLPTAGIIGGGMLLSHMGGDQQQQQQPPHPMY